ncbi:MAG: 30S ribosomal protein S8 [Candidatus Pacearchaeota archaeon]
MSQDVIADALNEIMNSKRARKNSVVVKRYSKLLLDILEIAKKYNYVDDFKTNKNKLEIYFSNIHECKAIKPRYNVNKINIVKYFRRYLPAVDIGIIIISTNRGLITHHEAIENKIGGSLIAYFY